MVISVWLLELPVLFSSLAPQKKNFKVNLPLGFAFNHFFFKYLKLLFASLLSPHTHTHTPNTPSNSCLFFVWPAYPSYDCKRMQLVFLMWFSSWPVPWDTGNCIIPFLDSLPDPGRISPCLSVFSVSDVSPWAEINWKAQRRTVVIYWTPGSYLFLGVAMFEF